MKSRKPISKTQSGLSAKLALKKITENRVSGATTIESEIISYFLNKHNFKSRNTTRKVISLLLKRFSQMANVISVLEAIEIYNNENPDSVICSLKNHRKITSGLKKITVAKTAVTISRYKSIFTLSNSTIIRDAIISAYKSGWRGEVNIIESRPMNEGTILAKHLSKKSIRVILSVDSTIHDRIKESSAVFLGADAVTSTYFVNKIGSNLAVDIALKSGKKVFVAAEPSKYISNLYYKFTRDYNPSSEIVSSSNKNLKTENYYFESVEPKGKFNYIRADRLLEPSKLNII